MANTLIYKDIGVQDEVSFGISLTANYTRLHVRTVTLNQTIDKMLVEDTTSNVKGRDRISRIKTTLEGDITGFITPRGVHQMLEMVNGAVATGTSMGASGSLFTYYQDTSGTSFLSKVVNLDRNNSQEKFLGVRAKSLELTASDSLAEYTLSVIAKTYGAGASMADILGETVKSFNFADNVLQINAGTTIGTAPITHKVSEWSIKYDNGLEATYLSGLEDITRSDPKIPTIEGKFTIFHEGASWTAGNYGSSEFYIRLTATLPSHGGLIAGVSPYVLRIDMPRTELTSTVRNYEQAEFGVEEIEFKGMFHPGLSLLWRPELTCGLSIIS